MRITKDEIKSALCIAAKNREGPLSLQEFCRKQETCRGCSFFHAHRANDYLTAFAERELSPMMPLEEEFFEI